MPSQHRRASLLTIAVVALTIAAAGLVTVAPALASPSQAARDAARRGAEWIASQQRVDGTFPTSNDDAPLGLAAGGLHAADVSNGGPSAQESRHSAWSSTGVGSNRAFDQARSTLGAIAAGIDPHRIAANRNFISHTANYFTGQNVFDSQIPGYLADDIYAGIAFSASGAPASLVRAVANYLLLAQNADGGWGYNEGSSHPDYTGAALVVICAGGVRPGDRALEDAEEYLRGFFNQATGGFGDPLGPNADTTGWVISGFTACGIDAASGEWTAPNGKNPVQFLLDLQHPTGGFKHNPSSSSPNLLATIDAARALSGHAFAVPPPTRPNGAARFRPPPVVSTTDAVPMTLVIDHGDGQPVDGPAKVRACEVKAKIGTSMEAFLSAAASANTLYPCLRLWGKGSSQGKPTIASVNGVDSKGNRVWYVQQNGGAERTAIDSAVGFGELVFLRYGTPPQPLNNNGTTGGNNNSGTTDNQTGNNQGAGSNGNGDTNGSTGSQSGEQTRPTGQVDGVARRSPRERSGGGRIPPREKESDAVQLQRVRLRTTIVDGQPTPVLDIGGVTWPDLLRGEATESRLKSANRRGHGAQLTQRSPYAVNVSLARRSGRSCRYVTSEGVLSRPFSCVRHRYLRAEGVAHWRIRVPAGDLPPGRYEIVVKAVRRGHSPHFARTTYRLSPRTISNARRAARHRARRNR